MNREEYYEHVCKKYHMSKGKRNFIIIGSPNHGNLGDVAITWASINLLQELYPQDNVFDINMADFPFEIDAIYHLITPEDIIILQGGGNLGNVYMDDEMIRRYVISRFLNNRIIIFPQTIFYTEDEAGKNELELSNRIYSKHKGLFLCARDSKSNDKAKKSLHVQSEMVPDVVLTQKYNKDVERKDVLLCLRNDREGNLDDEQKNHIKKVLCDSSFHVKETDTVINFDGNRKERTEKLYQKLDEFCEAKFVVTDRLHGLIFAVITNTPCIVLPTKGTKVTSVVHDIQNKNGIYLAENVRDIDEKIKYVSNCDKLEYDNIEIKNKFRQILESVTRKMVPQNLCNNDLDMAAYWNHKIYESNFWKEKMTEEYRKEEKNNGEKVEELKTYSEWVNNLNNKIKELQEIVEEKDEYIKKCDHKIKEYDQRIVEYDKRIVEYDKRIEDLEMKKENYIAENHKLNGIVEEGKRKLNEKEAIYNKNIIYLKKMEKELIQVEEEKKVMQKEIEKKNNQLQIESRELYDNLKKERNRNKEYENKIKNLEDEKQKILNELDELKSKNSMEQMKRGPIEKTIRCIRMYGIKHTFRSIKESMKEMK